MTETEWTDCADPGPMIRALNAREIPLRKFLRRSQRLFACACCREIWWLLEDERSRRAVEIAEAHANGMANRDDLLRAIREAEEAHCDFLSAVAAGGVGGADRGPGILRALREAAQAAEAALARDMVWARAARAVAAHAAWDLDLYYGTDPSGPIPEGDHPFLEALRSARADQAALLRDIFGNLFRPAAIDPAWLTPDVVELAREIKRGWDFGRMPDLADALEAAGCDCVEVLGHCCGPGPHARGCWVLEDILGVG